MLGERVQAREAGIHPVLEDEVAILLGDADRDDRRRPGLHPLAKHFRAGRDVAASLGGESLTLAAAERLELNHSYKYDASAFLEMLREAGLADRWHGTSGDGRFQMVLAGAA